MFIQNNLAPPPDISALQDALEALFAKAADLGLIGEAQSMAFDMVNVAAPGFPLERSSMRAILPRRKGRALLELAREMLRAQRARERFLPATVLRDLGWNILLDLYVHDCEGKRVAVSSACISSGGPSTTALRWLRTLEEDGLVVRKHDPNDKRRIFVSLTHAGREGIDQWLRHLS